MTPHPYQNAYDTAIAELTEIAATFEQLRVRKTRIESLVNALQPFFALQQEAGSAISVSAGAASAPVSPELSTVSVPSDAEPPEGYSFRDVPAPLPELTEGDGDPFQRRVKASFRFRGLATQRSY